jgi:hypothetical protein
MGDRNMVNFNWIQSLFGGLGSMVNGLQGMQSMPQLPYAPIHFQQGQSIPYFGTGIADYSPIFKMLSGRNVFFHERFIGACQRFNEKARRWGEEEIKI